LKPSEEAREIIIDRSRNPQFAGEISDAKILEGANPFCGDHIKLFVKVGENGIIEDFSHQTRACSICATATDFLAEEARGKTVAEALKINIPDLLSLPLSPTRRKCALLAQETLRELELE